MALHTVFKKIHHTIDQALASIGFSKNSFAGIIAVIAIAAAVAGAGWYGYAWYRANQEDAAQRMFSQDVQEYERVVQEGKNEDWASIETLFKLGYNQYSGSAFGPFFLVYQAQALIKQNKLQEGRAVLEQATQAMAASSELYPLFKIKVALLNLDHNEQEAVAQLQLLANDTKSHFNDAAAYYLGYYYWINNDETRAHEVWQKMINETQTHAKMGKSPWAALAQEKLAYTA